MLAVSGEPPITKGDASEIGDFGKKREGAMFLGINVTSAEAAADYLKTHNFFSWSSTFPPIGGTKLALKSDGSSQHVHGHSRIPAEITHGMWTEMFQVEDQP